MAKKKTDSKAAAKLQKKAKQETKVMPPLVSSRALRFRAEQLTPFNCCRQAAKNELKAVKGKGKSNEDDLEAVLAQVGGRGKLPVSR